MARCRLLGLTLTITMLLCSCGEIPVSPTPVSGAATPIPARTRTPLPPEQGTLSGIVLIGPMCPVVREDQPCPDQPYEAELVVQDQAGKDVARLRTGANGRFEVNLAPGTYTVIPQPPKGAPLPHPGQPQTVSLAAGLTVAITVTYDSGIR